MPKDTKTGFRPNWDPAQGNVRNIFYKPTSAGPGPLVPQSQPSAPFKFPTQNQPFAQREFGAFPTSPEPFAQREFGAFPTSPEPFAQREFGSVPDTSANALAMVKALSANRMNPGLTIPKPTPTPAGQPSPLSQGLDRAQQSYDQIEQSFSQGSGTNFLRKILTGADTLTSQKEYQQYRDHAQQTGAKPLDPRAYFIQQGNPKAAKDLGASDVNLMKMHAGDTKDLLSPGSRQFYDFAGRLGGQTAVLPPYARMGGMAAGKLIGTPLLKSAPTWIQKPVGEITGSLFNGGAYQTGMEGLQESAYPNQQTFGGHLSDIARKLIRRATLDAI